MSRVSLLLLMVLTGSFKSVCCSVINHTNAVPYDGGLESVMASLLISPWLSTMVQLCPGRQQEQGPCLFVSNSGEAVAYGVFYSVISKGISMDGGKVQVKGVKIPNPTLWYIGCFSETQQLLLEC